MAHSDLQQGAECLVPHQASGASGASPLAAPNAQRDHGRFLPGHTENARHFLDTDRVPAAYVEMSTALLSTRDRASAARADIAASSACCSAISVGSGRSSPVSPL